MKGRLVCRVWGSSALTSPNTYRRMARCWCIRVQGGCARAMEEAEGFFLTLGASIVRRDASSMDAVCVHPDGLQSSIAVNYATKGTGEEALRRGGATAAPGS